MDHCGLRVGDKEVSQEANVLFQVRDDDGLDQVVAIKKDEK